MFYVRTQPTLQLNSSFSESFTSIISRVLKENYLVCHHEHNKFPFEIFCGLHLCHLTVQTHQSVKGARAMKKRMAQIASLPPFYFYYQP